MRARSVWGRLGTLLRREGEEPKLLEMFYRLVSQTVLLLGYETWILSAPMERKVEGIHTSFLQQITGGLA